MSKLYAKLTREIDFDKTEMPELVKWYNENSGSKPIKKFADKATAIARCKALAQAVKELTSTEPAPKKGKAAKAEKAPKAAKAEVAPKADGEKGRKSSFAGKKIYRLHKDGNPRRPGSFGYRSFALIKDGMSYEDYLAAGGRNTDLTWDVKHGFTEVR